ncbi:hypothetical protein CLAIMM_15090, partial [Cladophialophora immunda]
FVQRRPTSSERPSVAQSGNVFIYEEKASGIRRWTDGRHWSASRVLGEFLIYGEPSASPHQSQRMDKESSPPLVEGPSEDRHRQVYGPLAKSFHFKPEELVKKTIKVKDTGHSGATWHLVSYYRPMEVLNGQLQTPSMNQALPCSCGINQEIRRRTESHPTATEQRTAVHCPRYAYGTISHPVSKMSDEPGSCWTTLNFTKPMPTRTQFHTWWWPIKAPCSGQLIASWTQVCSHGIHSFLAITLCDRHSVQIPMAKKRDSGGRKNALMHMVIEAYEAGNHKPWC